MVFAKSATTIFAFYVLKHTSHCFVFDKNMRTRGENSHLNKLIALTKYFILRGNNVTNNLRHRYK